MRSRAVLVGVMLAAISVAHYAVGVVTHPQHVVHVALELAYLLPVVMGAVWFAARGGLLTGCGAAALLGAHALVSWRERPMENANQLAMMLVFAGVGVVAGKLVEAERRTTREKLVEALAALESALGFRHEATRQHGERVAALAVRIGRELSLDPAQLERLRLAALVHDLGKIGVADDVLLKPRELTPAERLHVERHPVVAADILRQLSGAEPIAEIVASHHERLDGSGYPRGLRAAEIPREALVLAVADVYCALAEPRTYKPAMPRTAILEVMAPLAGAKLDSAAFDALRTVVSAPS
jgi:putative nucleotidyltransferase with HDIG domain